MTLREPKLLAALCLLTVFACVGKAEARKVNVAVPGLSQLIAFAVAKERGFYQEEGLDVELILMRAAVANQALIAGNVDFATTGAAGLTAALSGLPLRILFSTFRRPMFSLYGRPDIRDIKELRGKKIGVSSIGTGADSALREVLKRHGLEGGRDVVILVIGVTPTRYAALESGSVDASMLSPPFTFKAEEAGFREIINFGKEDLVEIQGSVVVHEGLLRSDPPLVEKFTRGTFKGFVYTRDNRSETIPIVARLNSIKGDVAEKMYDAVLRPAMTLDGTVSEEIQRKAIEHLIKRVGDRRPPLAKIFDYSLVRKIRAELEAKGWKPVF